MNLREIRHRTPALALPKIDQKILQTLGISMVALLPILVTISHAPPDLPLPKPTPVIGLLEEGVTISFVHGLIVNKVPELKINVDAGELDTLLKHPAIERRLPRPTDSSYVFFIMPPAFALDDSPSKVNPFMKKYLKQVDLNGKRPLLRDLPIYELMRYLSITMTNFKNSDARKEPFRKELDKQITLWVLRAMQTTDKDKTGFDYPPLPYDIQELVKNRTTFKTDYIPENILLAAGLPLKPSRETTPMPTPRR